MPTLNSPLSTLNYSLWSATESSTATDIEVLKPNWTKLARALCHAFGLDAKTADFGLFNTAQIGSWSCDAVPVILTMQRNSHELRAVIAELGLRLHRPYILLGPTNHHLDAHCQELLAHAGAAYFALEHTVIVSNNGNLHATKTPGDLFARFNPEPEDQDENAARQAFAMLQNLEPESRRKPPSVIKVFRMYCMEELSAHEVSSRCHCSKTTVVDRLNVIRAKTGVAPQELRRLSVHLEKIKDDLTDSRARSIYRKGAIYGDEENEQQD